MKKWTFLLIGMLLSVFVLSSISFAYNPAKQHARQVYRRTAEVLVAAQDSTRRRHRYEGLSQAIRHQRIAKDYYYTRNYQLSINHSLRARELAYDVIERNNRRYHRPSFDRIEMRYWRNARQADLDSKAGRGHNDDDEVSVKLKINLDL